MPLLWQWTSATAAVAALVGTSLSWTTLPVSYSLVVPVSAFSIPQGQKQYRLSKRYFERRPHGSHRVVVSLRSTTDSADGATSAAASAVETYLQQNHDMFWNMIMARNDKLWKVLREASFTGGITIFAPTNEGMVALGERKLSQLQDYRNEETVLRMGDFHAVNEAVTADTLFNSAGIIPVAKDVIVVDRTRTGGMFGILGGQEDGGFTVGGARVVESIAMGSSFIHRTDTLVSPSILWRYCDQLRIPGSK